MRSLLLPLLHPHAATGMRRSPDNLPLEEFLTRLYGAGAEGARQRYEAIATHYGQLFGGEPALFASAPGRVEIGGNHTDHNHGCVIAASVNLDAVAAAGPADDDVITIVSEGYAHAVTVSCKELTVRESERGTTRALVRGIAARFREKGYKVAGFRACIRSQVAPGSGLSSSAAVEVLFGTILNALYNEGKIPPAEIAAIGQYAENVYFGKPCGLMDQVASAVGGIVTIDFGDPARPVIRRLQQVVHGVRPAGPCRPYRWKSCGPDTRICRRSGGDEGGCTCVGGRSVPRYPGRGCARGSHSPTPHRPR